MSLGSKLNIDEPIYSLKRRVEGILLTAPRRTLLVGPDGGTACGSPTGGRTRMVVKQAKREESLSEGAR